jgi:hypothetical protein
MVLIIEPNPKYAQLLYWAVVETLGIRERLSGSVICMSGVDDGTHQHHLNYSREQLIGIITDDEVNVILLAEDICSGAMKSQELLDLATKLDKPVIGTAIHPPPEWNPTYNFAAKHLLTFYRDEECAGAPDEVVVEDSLEDAFASVAFSVLPAVA